MIKAVIFDQDGVLIDSEPIYLSWFKDFLDYNNIKVETEEFNSLAGCSAKMEKVLLHKWWNENKKESLTEDEVFTLCEKYWEDEKVEEEFSYKKVKNPNVEEVMKQLKNLGCIIVIASSSSMANIKSAVKEIEIEKYIDLIVSGEMFQESKPNPEIYNYTLNKLGLKSNECISIEDSTYGILASKNAGITTVAKIDNRFHFDQSPADYRINDLIEIIDIINNYSLIK